VFSKASLGGMLGAGLVAAGVTLGSVWLSAPTGAAEKPSAWEAPKAASEVKNPIPADAKSIAAGKTVYTQQCAACHGTTGKGDGPAAIALKTKPGDLSDPKMWQQTDGALFWKISEGRESMPAYKKLLTDEQRWNVVNHTRTLAKKPG